MISKAPQSSSSAESTRHGANGRQNNSKEGQNIGTPRKAKKEGSLPRASQDAELKDYVRCFYTLNSEG